MMGCSTAKRARRIALNDGWVGGPGVLHVVFFPAWDALAKRRHCRWLNAIIVNNAYTARCEESIMKFRSATVGARCALTLLLGLVGVQRLGCATEPAENARGAALAAACVACHGGDGNTPNPALYPNLASQDRAYLVLQLKNFQSGERSNAIMKSIAASLSPAQMEDLAAYFSSQLAKPQKSLDATLEARGRTVFTSGSKAGAPACVTCHGAKGEGQAIFPRIASQSAKYTLDQLHTYRDAASFQNPLAMQMKQVAKNVSEDEMRAVAAYLSTLN